MWRHAIATTVALWCVLTLAHAQDQLTATTKEERVSVPDEPNRQGLQMVKRSLLLGPVAFRYQQLVDPSAGDKPVVQRYADYILGCEFPRYTWNWDLEYFLDVTVTRPGDPPFVANRATLQRGIYVLQQGRRAVADMVWPLPPSAGRTHGELVVRFVKTPDDPNWMHVRVTIEGDPAATITQVALHSYPTVTTGPPERQRWVTSLTRAVQSTDKPAARNPADEWGLVLHNRLAQEEGGALLVMDPDEIKIADASGVYPIAVRLQPNPTQSVRFAMGYFWDTPYDKAVASFRQQAPDRLKRLRAVDWSVPLDLARWEKNKRDVEELLSLTEAARTQYQPQWTALAAQADEALKQAATHQDADPGAARRFVLLSRQAEELRAKLYEPALQALIEGATR
ncbi:MAG: hypothetical protein COY42_09910 [Armatimonadetes bacterium CG_4_10_14_0_8_um_filter_66_14]|nr:hypothetical protein [Armatimonadota bacterium]NDK16020.1 hypothetical protein [Armatimonadota bacterium]OIP07573.1 MAG: hypothetical protein AUJ96_07120 [Armatimonadetes bacterium CG2_30_66_41]PIZ46808.1 MAG: hypothetical protein COY42_09910 [Armatimonadetes bacterium CG_4_10_14_0_8_um_filter_66_14]